MRFLDYLALAWRSLRRSRLRTGLTVGAIVVGATGLTVMLTFVTTVKTFIEDQFVQSGQDRQIEVALGSDLKFDASGETNGGGSPAGSSTTGNSGTVVAVITPAVEAKIATIPHVHGVAAVLPNLRPALQYVSLGSRQAAASFMLGIEPNGVITPTMLAGTAFTKADTSGVILLTQDYADALGFKGNYAKLVGQTVDLHTITGYTGVGATLPTVLPQQVPCQPSPNRPPSCTPGSTSGLPSVVLSARVVGVVDPSFNKGTLYVPLPWLLAMSNQSTPVGVRYPAQQPGQPGQQGVPTGQGTVTGGWTKPANDKFVADNGGYQSLLVKVDSTDQVHAVAQQIDQLGVSTATGQKELDRRKDVANTVGLVLGGLGLVALGIAALGVMNTMVMSVLERTREIGVMRAVGARRRTIRRLFTFEAATLGFLGGAIGLALGYAILLGAKQAIKDAVDTGAVRDASFAVPLWLIGAVLVLTTAIGLISGFIPARRAARLDPVEALRYE